MAFRPMRRSAQALPRQEALRILTHCSTGVLAVAGDDGYPYAVPINFVLVGESVYFHCAKVGHKLDGIRNNPKVSLCVVEDDRVIAEDFSTDYRSAILFGTACIVEDVQEQLRALTLFNEKYSPAYPEQGQETIKKEFPGVCIVRIDIEHLTAKAAMSNIKRRGGNS